MKRTIQALVPLSPSSHGQSDKIYVFHPEEFYEPRQDESIMSRQLREAISLNSRPSLFLSLMYPPPPPMTGLKESP